MMSFSERLALIAVLLYLSCYVPTSNGQDFTRVFQKPWERTGPYSFPSTSDADDSEVYAKVLTLFRKYWRNEWSDFPPEVVEKLIEAKDQHINAEDSANRTCRDGWEYLVTHRVEDSGSNLTLAAKAVDAFGKPGAGILEGNVVAYGSYDECLSSDHTQYCLVPFVVLQTSGVGSTPLSALMPIRVGMCLPKECTQQDIADAALAVDQILKSLNVSYAVYPTDPYCESEKQLPYNAGAIVMIVVCSLFALLVLVGTGIDWATDVVDFVCPPPPPYSVHVNPDLEAGEEKAPLLGDSSAPVKEKPLPLKLITAFSLFKTVPTIMSTNQPPAAITCVHGIRVISICWVILGHTHLWTFTETGVSNPLYAFTSVAPRFSFQAVANGFYSVDSFFFLSGLLIAYLTLRTMSRKNGRFPAISFYLHRYLRLTPSYAFILFFYWFLTMHLVDGPAYHSGTDVHSILYKNCKDYWWTNLLYINNLYPWKLAEECLGWSWYLANDMQFFVVSPLLIVLLYYNPLIGFLSVGVFLAGTFAATGAIAGYYGFDASFLGLASPDTVVTFSDEIYVKPYARISPYLVGIILGYLLFKKVKIPFRRLYNWMVYIPLWVVAALLGIAVIYGLHDTWHGHTLSLAEDVLYITFSRFTWGLALAIMVFACHNGYGWVINSFLSMKFWIPLSRLCFNAYLVHEIVLTVIFGQLRTPVYYTDISIAVYTIGAVAISFGVAGVVAVFVEFPLGSIEVLLFKIVGLGSRESTRHGTVSNGVMMKTPEQK